VVQNVVEFRAEFEAHGPQHVVEGYGLSEASPVTHVNPIDQRNRPGTIGLPVPDTDARIVDEEIKKLLVDAHNKVRDALASHRQALEELAKLLLCKEVVERPELLAILKVRNIGSYKEKERVQTEKSDAAEERKT